MKLYNQQNITSTLILAVVSFQLVFPSSVAAQVIKKPQTVVKPTEVIIASVDRSPVNLVMPIRQYKVLDTYTIPISAYNSLPGQTDSTPCTTANGFDVCENDEENVLAANFLPFGTKVRIPEYFGDRIFTVQDRMNKRYYYRADIWMKDYDDAIKWGLKYATIEVVE